MIFAMDLTGQSPFVFNLAALIGLAGIISAWVTLRLTVKHQGEMLREFRAEIRAELAAEKSKIASLGRWRERLTGARDALNERGESDSVIPRVRSTESGPNP